MRGPYLRRTFQLLRAVLALGLVAAFGGVCLAATAAWEPYPAGSGGPWGGSVRKLAADAEGNKLWAATGGGIYYSANGGTSWQARSAGLSDLDVTDVDVSRAVPSKLIASTAHAGLYLSSDGGASWTPAPGEILVNEVLQESFLRVAIDPADADHLFAATFDQSSRLYESTDAGQTWADVGGFPVSRLVFGQNGTLFVATSDGRILKKPRAAVVSVLVAFEDRTEIADLALPGGDEETLTAARGGAGLWVSEDGGSSWDERHFRYYPDDPQNPSFLEVDAVASDPLNANRLLYHVADGGMQEQTELYSSDDLCLSAATPTGLLPEQGMDVQELLVTKAAEWIGENHAGAFRRQNRLGSFLHSSSGIAAFSSRDFAFSSEEAGALAVAGGFGGPSQDGNAGMNLWDPSGRSWRRIGVGLPSGITERVRYRGAELWLGGLHGLYVSADDGTTWVSRNQGLGETVLKSIYGLSFSELDPDIGVVGTQGGVYRTADGGGLWSRATEIPESIGWRVVPDRREASAFYAGGKQGNSGRFFASGREAVSWTEFGTGSLVGKQIESLAASSQIDEHVLIGTVSGELLESFDGGESWEQVAGVPDFGKPVSAVAIAGAPGDVWMAAAIEEHGVYVSSNGGVDWVRVDEGLIQPGGRYPYVYALAFEPGSTGRLILGAADRGLMFLDLRGGDLPPWGVVQISGGAIYARSRDVALRLSAVDAEGPVGWMRVSPDGQSWPAWEPYSSTRAWTLSNGDGVKSVSVQFKDGAGNLSAVASDTIVVDTVPPLVGITAPAEGAQVGILPTLLFAVSDGVVVVELDGAAIDAASGDTLGPLDPGQHRVRVTATDPAGNTAVDEVAFSVTVDSGGGGGGGGGGAGGGGGCFAETLGSLGASALGWALIVLGPFAVRAAGRRRKAQPG